METLSLWASRLEKRVAELEHEVRDLRARVGVHESRVTREEVHVRPTDPRADLDEVPTKRHRRSSTALEAAKRASDIIERALATDSDDTD